MKEIIGALLIAASMSAFYELANAAPPPYYVNREAGSDLYATSYDETDGWRYTDVYAWDNYDKKGTYVDSGFWVAESGYSATLGDFYFRYVSCNVGRGAVQIGQAATTATFSAYVADLSSCSNAYFNIEPFTEVDVSVTLSTPWRNRKENLSGTELKEHSTFHYTCKIMRGESYLSVAGTLNGETWSPPAEGLFFYAEAFSAVCNVKTK